MGKTHFSSWPKLDVPYGWGNLFWGLVILRRPFNRLSNSVMKSSVGLEHSWRISCSFNFCCSLGTSRRSSRSITGPGTSASVFSLSGYWYSSCSRALIHSSRSSQRCRSLRLYFMVSLPSFLCDDSSPGFSGVWKVTRGNALELLAILTTSSFLSLAALLSCNECLPAAPGSQHEPLVDAGGRQHWWCQGAVAGAVGRATRNQ